MLTAIYTKRFEKDVELAKRRNKHLEKLKEVIRALVAQESLDICYKDHVLTGNYSGRRECHIEPNWLLIYKLEEARIIFERTGTHSDLF